MRPRNRSCNSRPQTQRGRGKSKTPDWLKDQEKAWLTRKKVNMRSVYTAVLGIAVAVAISLVMVTEMDDDDDDPCDDPDYKAADGMPTDDGRLMGELCDHGNESAAEWQERVRKWNRDRRCRRPIGSPTSSTMSANWRWPGTHILRDK